MPQLNYGTDGSRRTSRLAIACSLASAAAPFWYRMIRVCITHGRRPFGRFEFGLGMLPPAAAITLGVLALHTVYTGKGGKGAWFSWQAWLTYLGIGFGALLGWSIIYMATRGPSEAYW